MYESLASLPILKFWEIEPSKNFALLDLDYFDGKQYSVEESADLSRMWLKLYDDYFSERNDMDSVHSLRRTMKDMKTIQTLVVLQDIRNELFLLFELAQIMPFEWVEQERYAIIDQIKELSPRTEINMFDDIRELIDLTESLAKSFQNVHNEQVKVTAKKAENKKQSIYKIHAAMEMVTSIPKDIETMSCEVFLAQEYVVMQKQKQSEKTTGNGRK